MGQIEINKTISKTLKDYLNKHKYKYSHLEEILGISQNSFSMKMNNHHPWHPADKIILFKKGIITKSEL